MAVPEAAGTVAARPSTPGPRRPPRVAALDGIRGVALLGVLAYHAAPGAMGGGFLGVESFFVLSGYLLATLLVAEKNCRVRIDCWDYAARRIRRIAPALLALLAALVLLVPVLAADGVHRLAGDVISSLTGTTNWHLIADASSYFDTAGRPSLVRHLWSVAVEIQFYAVCPLLVTWLWRRRRGLALAALGVGVAASSTAMALLYQSGDPSRAYYGTDARVGALLSGVALALVLSGGRGDRPPRLVPRRIDALGRLLVAGAPLSLAALVALYVLADDRARWAYPVVFLATQALTLALIVAARRPGATTRLLGTPVLGWMGTRSFGIYLWHWPAVVVLRPGIDVGLHPALAAIASLAVAFTLGTLSYRIVERPFLRRRRQPLPQPFRARRQAVLAMVSLVAVAGLAGLLVRLPTDDPLAETLRAGERLLASQPVPTLIPSTLESAPMGPSTLVAPTTTPSALAPPSLPLSLPLVTAPPRPVRTTISPPPTSPPPPPPAPVPTPATVPAGVSVRAIGDSVMVSAAGALQERLGASAYIDAALNRQFSDGITAARAIREAGGADVVVVHLGNNGPVAPADVDGLMGELAGARAVLLVNVRVDRPWRASVNQTLAEATQRHPRARLVDWYGASEGHPDWFQGDGTHFRASNGPGAKAFADLIAGAVPPPPSTTTSSSSSTVLGWSPARSAPVV